jgi:hypothetical protein
VILLLVWSHDIDQQYSYANPWLWKSNQVTCDVGEIEIVLQFKVSELEFLLQSRSTPRSSHTPFQRKRFDGNFRSLHFTNPLSVNVGEIGYCFAALFLLCASIQIVLILGVFPCGFTYVAFSKATSTHSCAFRLSCWATVSELSLLLVVVLASQRMSAPRIAISGSGIPIGRDAEPPAPRWTLRGDGGPPSRSPLRTSSSNNFPALVLHVIVVCSAWLSRIHNVLYRSRSRRQMPATPSSSSRLGSPLSARHGTPRRQHSFFGSPVSHSRTNGLGSGQDSDGDVLGMGRPASTSKINVGVRIRPLLITGFITTTFLVKSVACLYELLIRRG